MKLQIRGFTVWIDNSDWQLLANRKWHISGQKGSEVARTFIRTDWSTGKRRYIYATMQQLIMGERTGFEIDHRNHNTLDNQRRNLRWATPAQNVCNRVLPNKTGFKGVFPNGKRFAAKIHKCRTQQIYLGTFDTAAEAGEAYRIAAIALFGEFACIESKPRKEKA